MQTGFAFATEGWYTATMTTYRQMLRLFSRNVRIFLVMAALIGFAWDGVRTVIFNLYLLRLDYGPETIGLISSVGTLAFALSCPPAGVIGTRWSSRNTLIVGAGFLAVGFGAQPLAEFFVGDWRTGWLLATSILTFFGFALYLVNSLPFLMSCTSPQERSHVFSFHIALLPLAGFVGSLVAGALPGVFASILGLTLDEAAPYRLTLWLAALVLIPGVLVLLRTRAVAEQATQTTASNALDVDTNRPPHGLFIAIGLIMALRFGGRGAVVTFFNVYLDEALAVSTALIGTLSAAGQLLSVPAALVAPLVVARWGSLRVIFWGTLGIGLATLPLALVPHWPAAGLGYLGSTAFFLLTTGPFRVYSQELVTPRWQTSMASAFMMGAGLAFSVMALASGYAITALGYRPIFLVGAGLVAVSALVFGAYFRVPRGEMARQPVPETVESV
jgi:MFS family permease